MNTEVATGTSEALAPHRGLITISVMSASLMQSLDTTIANVALPHVQGSLSASQDQMTWVLTSYILAAGIMTPLSGWLAGRFGRKRIFLYSVAGFTMASALCGMALSLPQIVLARVLQGLCGAALVPMSQAVLLDIYPPSQHPRAMAIWMMAVVVGPILGPVLGGWLTESYSWRWVFFINLPFGILSFIGAGTYMRETHSKKSRFDFFGFSTLSLSIGALQLLLDRGQTLDWFNSNEIWAEAIVAALAFYLFLVHVITEHAPGFISSAMFKDRNFTTGSILVFLSGTAMFATLALTPPLLQDLLQYPVALTGLLMAPRGLGTMVSTFIVVRFMTKIDPRLIVAFGFGITAFSLWQMSNFSLQMNDASVIATGIGQGVGMGFVYLMLSSVTFATLPTYLRNEGTAMLSLIRNVGSSIGISVVEAFLTRNTQIAHSRLAGQITPFSDILHLHPGAAAAATRDMALLNASVTEQAAMIAYNADFKLTMIITLCALPLAALLRPQKSNALTETVVME